MWLDFGRSTVEVERPKRVSTDRGVRGLVHICLGVGLLSPQPQSKENHTGKEDSLLGSSLQVCRTGKYNIFSLGKLERNIESRPQAEALGGFL